MHVFDKLGRVEVEEATAGDIAAVVGMDTVEIGDTIADAEQPVALPRLTVDPPTLQMVFGVNTSPFVGRSGKFLTTRHLRERLEHELEKNVALQVDPLEGTEQFVVSGRGLLHLSVLIETMRREGYELSIGKPHVILRDVDGVKEEPFESLVIEVPHEKMGPVMELVGARRGKMIEMHGRSDYAAFDVFDTSPGLNRPADAAAQRDAGDGDYASPVRDVSADGRRNPEPTERRAGLNGRGQSVRLRFEHAAGAVGIVHQAGRRSL